MKFSSASVIVILHKLCWIADFYRFFPDGNYSPGPYRRLEDVPVCLKAAPVVLPQKGIAGMLIIYIMYICMDVYMWMYMLYACMYVLWHVMNDEPPL